jgi:guanylate kinase
LVIISGPSGVGKSTLAAELLNRRASLVTVPSWTTRKPRPGDGKGKSYRFVTRTEFEAHREADGFLESAEVHGELYGTPADEVEAALEQGRDVLLEIDVQGARQVRSKRPEAISIFVRPPSWEELVARLERRGTEDPEGLRTRLETARRELDEAPRFDHQVVNDRLEQAVEEVDRILDDRP